MVWWALWAVAEAATCAGGPREPWTRVVPLGGQAEGRTLVAMATADLDGDGQDEPYGLLGAPDGSLDLWATVIDERGPLSAVGPVPLVIGTAAAGAGPVVFWGRDADGDGFTDLVVLDGRGTPTLGLWTGHGDGGTSQMWSRKVAAGIVVALAADLDGNHQLDLFGPTTAGRRWHVELGLGVPDESLDAAPVEPGGVGASVDAAITDLDGDGTLDLVTAGGVAGTVGWVPGLGSYDDATRIRAKSRDVGRVAAGDIDGDGDGDVILLDVPKGRLRWLQGAATPTLGPVVRKLDASERGAVPGVHLLDLDHDGCLDLLLDGLDGEIEVGWGHGDGAFSPQRLDVGGGPWATGDVDGDGYAELLVYGSGRVTLVDTTPVDAP